MLRIPKKAAEPVKQEPVKLLAQVIAKNKPADGYLCTVQRDAQGRISGLVAKRGRNAN